MFDRQPTDVVGKTLVEADPALFEETRDHLESGSMSYAAHVLTDAERAVVLARLETAKIRSTCTCGQQNCRTYRFDVPPKGEGAERSTIRFHVVGELLMEIDSDLDVYDVERLYEEENDGATRTVYFLTPDDTWGSIELPAPSTTEGPPAGGGAA
jgi:hypothetical protein